MPLEFQDLIAALASAPGSAERGIVRISGRQVVELVARHFRSHDGTAVATVTRARCFAGVFRLKAIDELLPASLLVWPTDRSYTGQPMAELHTVGSPPLLEAILSQLYDDEVRPARNGEFTLRAFLSGRVDLVQAEAVLGVIDSTDQQQMERALRQLGGGVSGRLATTRMELIAILGDLEAGLDFVEEDIEFIPADVMIARLNVAIERLQALADSSEARMESTTRVPVVLAGLPNAGKSTLFNALAASELAIVSEVAGTTRDYLTTDIDCDGVAVQLIDTAGQEAGASEIMLQAQQLRSDQVDEADVVVWCSAANLTSDDHAMNEQMRVKMESSAGAVLHVVTKADLLNAAPAGDVIAVSASDGSGLKRLTQSIAGLLRSTSSESELIGSTSARCRDSLSTAIRSLQSARDAAQSRTGDEIIAIELRDALEHIGTILGTVYTDDILDHVFSNFCIGK